MAFPVKRLPDGRAMLNVGCGTKMNPQWNNIDFSLYARLARHPFVARLLHQFGLLSNERFRTLSQVDPAILHWDLLNGIPFGDNAFDVLYHSHFLEHLDKNLATFVLRECYRVLKPGGSIRIAVPDLYAIVMRYVSSVAQLEKGDTSALTDHQQAIDDLFEQMVRQEPWGTTLQRGWVRGIERFLRGDAAAAGELHRWMYDRYSLGELMSCVSFRGIKTETPSSSAIDGWSDFGLDVNEDGTVYKPGSLYIEGRK